MSKVSAIPRSAWQDPAKPVTGPAPRGVPGTWVIHYPGGGIAPIGAAIKQYLQNIQSEYLRTRGYSIGYSWGVGQDGSKWEIRGDDINPASNPGKKRKAETGIDINFNNISRSIFVMVSGSDPASPKAVSAINEIIATEPDWDVITHGVVDYTSCAGAGLNAQVVNGTIGQQAVVTPPEQPLQGVPDMFHPVQPFRNSDTRVFGGAGLPAGDHAFGLNIPKGAVAVAINVTMVNPQGAGFVTVWPSGPRPNTSCLNFSGAPGATSNSVIVGVNDQGGLSIYNSVTGHLIVDVTGYWTP